MINSMKKFSYLLSVAIVAIFSTVLIGGCGEIIRENPSEPIRANHSYYIYAAMPYSFITSDGVAFTLGYNDHTSLMFDADFQTMTIFLDVGGGLPRVPIVFVVTQVSLAGNNISATVERVFQGNIIRYSVSSDANFVYFYTTTRQVVSIATNDQPEPQLVTIHPNVRALTFARTRPSHIVTGGS